MKKVRRITRNRPTSARPFILAVILAATLVAGCAQRDGKALADPNSIIPKLAWTDTVGAKTFPKTLTVFLADDFGAVGDGVTMNTAAIQKTLDEAEMAGGGIVTFRPGMYVTGSLFIGDNTNFVVPKGTTLLGAQDINDYKKIDTRVAGIEMNWPAALVNIIGKRNSAITGDGVIDGRGRIFWESYYTLRQEYNPKGLRWIVDYDCERPRGILVSDCKDITLKDFVLYRPGFWSVHILYSHSVTVDGITISNNIEMDGPSTDGIDVDSSVSVWIKNSDINCNDDNFCLKAGRDADGLRVNRPCEYVLIEDCHAGLGGGLITCGSETSGGIRNIVARNLKASGTLNGLRFKSTFQRGGTIENIYCYNIQMDSVRLPLGVNLNWHPAYSNSILPEGYDYDKLPAHWKKMLEQVPPDKGAPKFRNIYFENIKAVGARLCLQCEGQEKSTLDNFHFRNVTLQGDQDGTVAFDVNWEKDNLTVNGKNL